MSFILKDAPKAPDILSQSQVDLETNLLYFVNSLGKDHQVVIGDSNTTSFEGRHLQVSFKNRAGTVANPGDGTSSFVYDNGGNLFWNNPTIANVQLTNQNIGVPVVAANGYTWLTGGLMLQWGIVTPANTNPTNVITYPLAFAATFVPPPQVTAFRPSGGGSVTVDFYVTGASNTGFTINNAATGTGLGYYWYAIGAK